MRIRLKKPMGMDSNLANKSRRRSWITDSPISRASRWRKWAVTSVNKMNASSPATDQRVALTFCPAIGPLTK